MLSAAPPSSATRVETCNMISFLLFFFHIDYYWPILNTIVDQFIHSLSFLSEIANQKFEKEETWINRFHGSYTMYQSDVKNVLTSSAREHLRALCYI